MHGQRKPCSGHPLYRAAHLLSHFCTCRELGCTASSLSSLLRVLQGTVCPCVWQRASRASPSYAGIGKAQTHRCRAARPCDSLCLATSDFCALSFCSQMNAMGFLFTLANKRERRKKKHTPGVWSTWQKGEWGPVTQTRAPAVSAELGHVTPRKLWFHPCTTDIVVNNPCSINQTMK